MQPSTRMSVRRVSLALLVALSTLPALTRPAQAAPGANSPFAGMSQREMWCQVLEQGISSPARKAHAREECFGKRARFDKVGSWQGVITLTRHYTCADQSGTKTVRARFGLKRTPYVSNAEITSAIKGRAPAAATVFQQAMARMQGAQVVIRRDPTTGYTESPNELSWFLTTGKLDASIGTHGSDGDTTHSENGSGSAAISKQARLIFDLEQGTWSLELPPVDEKGFPVTLVTSSQEGTTTEHGRESLDDLNSLDGFTSDQGLNKLPGNGLQLVGHATTRQGDCERDELSWRLGPAANCKAYQNLVVDINGIDPSNPPHWVLDRKEHPTRSDPSQLSGDAEYLKDYQKGAIAHIGDMLHWVLPKVPGITFEPAPADLRGPRLTVVTAGMPTENTDFGRVSVTATIPELVQCLVPNTKPVELFYKRGGHGNPKGKQEPNWFYYWLQTRAGDGHTSADVVYDGTRGTCHSGKKKGHIAGYFGWSPNDDRVIHLCRGIIAIPWTNPVTGRVTTGIDSFATTVLHEFGHKKHYDEWWLKIDQQIAADKKRGDKHDATTLVIRRALLDRDDDDIPDALECHRSKTTGKQVCPRWPGIIAGIFDSCRRSGGRDPDHSDEHCLIYRYEQTKWRVGTADKQDWACPGKQSGKTCGVDPAVKAAADLLDDDPGTGATEPSSAHARASGGDPGAATVESVGTATKPNVPQGPSTSRVPSPASAARLLSSPNPIVQQRGLAAIEALSALSPPQRAEIILPAFKRILTGSSTVPVAFNTGFIPREDWIRLQYLSSVAALGPKALLTLRAARDKASGVYREYLTLSLAAAGESHPLRLLKPLVRHGSSWVIRRQAVFLLGDRVGERADVQLLLKATLHDPGQATWRSDVGGLHGYQRQLYPVRDAAALMLYDAGYAIDRTKDGEYAAVWTPAVKHAASGANAAPVRR